MSKNNKYTVYCLDGSNKKQTVLVFANNKVEAKEIVLSNHPKYEATSVLSQEEFKAIKESI